MVQESSGRLFPVSPRKSLQPYADRRSEVRRCFWRARRFNRLDPFFGVLRDPLSLHKYLYVHGNPVSGTDPAGASLLGEGLSGLMIRASLAGGAFSTAGTVLYNQSVGLPWYAGLWYMAPIGMALGPAMVLSPAIAYAISVYGIAVGTAVAIDTWSDPNTTAWQRLNASVLAVFAIYGGVRGITYFHENNAIGMGWYRPPSMINPDFVPPLTAEEVNNLITQSAGQEVVVYTRLDVPPSPSQQLHVTPQAEMTTGVAGAPASPCTRGVFHDSYGIDWYTRATSRRRRRWKWAERWVRSIEFRQRAHRS